MVSTEVFSHNSWNNLLSFEAPALEVSYSPLFKDTFFPMKYFSISIQFSQPLTMALHRNQHHFPSYQTHPSNYETLKCATVCIQSTLCLMGTLAAFFDGANAPAYVPFSQPNCTGEPPNRLIQVYTWSGTQGNWWASISQFNSMLIAKEWASWSIFFSSFMLSKPDGNTACTHLGFGDSRKHECQILKRWAAARCAICTNGWLFWIFGNRIILLWMRSYAEWYWEEVFLDMTSNCTKCVKLND